MTINKDLFHLGNEVVRQRQQLSYIFQDPYLTRSSELRIAFEEMLELIDQIRLIAGNLKDESMGKEEKSKEEEPKPEKRIWQFVMKANTKEAIEIERLLKNSGFNVGLSILNTEFE